MSENFSIFNDTPELKRLSEMVFVEGGTFMMGSNDEEAVENKKNVNKVTFDFPFFIGKYPVTQLLWKAVMGEKTNPSFFLNDKRPVERISWEIAIVFCNALNSFCNYQPCYFKDALFKNIYGKTKTRYTLHKRKEAFFKPNIIGFRLPSEAQWEYASRGGNKSGNYLYAGSDNIEEVAWYGWDIENSHGETKIVGLKLANELGVHDMSGNIMEWCEDDYHFQYITEHNDGSALNIINAGKYRAKFLRGGCYCSSRVECRNSSRFSSVFPLNDGPNYIGFRLVFQTTKN